MEGNSSKKFPRPVISNNLLIFSKGNHFISFFSYANITKDLKLEWYYFQLNANEVVDTYLGPYLDPEEEEEDEYSGYKPTIEKNDDYNDG